MARTFTAKSGSEYADVEDGEYAATITKIEDLDTQYGPAYKIYFDLGDGVVLTGLCNVPDSLTPKTKIYMWYCASMVRKELEENEAVDVDDMIGCKCRVIVENREGKERAWATVIKLLPPRGKAKTAPKRSDDDDIDNM